MSRLEESAKERVARDELLEMEEILASGSSGPDLSLPSGLDFDFSDVPYPEDGGGPVSFWAGSFGDNVVGGPGNSTNA